MAGHELLAFAHTNTALNTACAEMIVLMSFSRVYTLNARPGRSSSWPAPIGKIIMMMTVAVPPLNIWKSTQVQRHWKLILEPPQDLQPQRKILDASEPFQKRSKCLTMTYSRNSMSNEETAPYKALLLRYDFVHSVLLDVAILREFGHFLLCSVTSYLWCFLVKLLFEKHKKKKIRGGQSYFW